MQASLFELSWQGHHQRGVTGLVHIWFPMEALEKRIFKNVWSHQAGAGEELKPFTQSGLHVISTLVWSTQACDHAQRLYRRVLPSSCCGVAPCKQYMLRSTKLCSYILQIWWAGICLVCKGISLTRLIHPEAEFSLCCASSTVLQGALHEWNDVLTTGNWADLTSPDKGPHASLPVSGVKAERK